MNGKGTGRRLALLLSLGLVAGTAMARDVYKGSLDPDIPRHRAVLEILSQLEANPKDAGLKNDLGCLIAQEGFWKDALREFDEAADLAPKDDRPSFNAGLVKAAKGEWYGARNYFQKATKRNPGNWPAWWMTGFAEEQLRNPSAAVEAYKVSLRVDTSLFDVSVNPYAAWSQLRSRVYLETYESRRVRALLPKSEQLENPEMVASFFQKSKKGGPPAGAPVPSAPTPEPRSGPVISAVPAASSAPSAPPPSAPVWNPRTTSRGRGEPVPAAPTPAPTPPPAAPPAPGAKPAPAVAGDLVRVEGEGAGSPGTVAPTPGGPGVLRGPGGMRPPAPN